MWESFVSVLTALVPPHPSSSSDKDVYRWRIATASVTGVTFIMTTGITLWLIGWLSVVGLPGPVSAGEIASLRQEQQSLAQQIVGRLDAIEQGQLSNKAENARRAVIDYTEKLCGAQNEDTRRNYLDQQSQALSAWYQATNNRPFNIPGCGAVVTGQQ